MNSRDIEEQLRTFLDWEHARRQRGETLEALHAKADQLHAAMMRIASDRLHDRQTLERYGRRIRRVEHQVSLQAASTPAIPDWRPDPSEVTGTHQFQNIQRQLQEIEERHEEEERERREATLWWKRQGWLWAGAIAVGLLVAAVSGCVTYVVAHAPASSPLVAPKP